MAEKAGLAERRAERREMMISGNLLKVIPIVALPMIVSMLIDALYNLADTYFVSQLGITATAAVGVNDSLLHLMRSVAMAFGMGASSPISKLMGAKREDEASRVASTAVFSSMIMLSFLAAIAYAFRESFVVFLGATEGATPYAVEYATFILISAPFTAG
ncbi:MAG: MATE family efflux transporter, partial [Firmicutes bacterium]|nr:MATE family efflux transporter [Bacillota bacterium]